MALWLGGCVCGWVSVPISAEWFACRRRFWDIWTDSDHRPWFFWDKLKRGFGQNRQNRHSTRVLFSESAGERGTLNPGEPSILYQFLKVKL